MTTFLTTIHEKLSSHILLTSVKDRTFNRRMKISNMKNLLNSFTACCFTKVISRHFKYMRAAWSGWTLYALVKRVRAVSKSIIAIKKYYIIILPYYHFTIVVIICRTFRQTLPKYAVSSFESIFLLLLTKNKSVYV